MWILIVINVVYGGQSVTTREFYNPKSCAEALEFIKTNSRISSYVNGICIKNSRLWTE